MVSYRELRKKYSGDHLQRLVFHGLLVPVRKTKRPSSWKFDPKDVEFIDYMSNYIIIEDLEREWFSTGSDLQVSDLI